MYEDRTFDIILDEMLTAVKDIDANIDTREGSVAYIACAPFALELADTYTRLETYIANSFLDTAAREFLVRRALERGLVPTQPTNALRRGVFNLNTLTEGDTFNLNTLNYVVTDAAPVLIESTDEGYSASQNRYYYQLRCATEGTAGNEESGTLTPIDSTAGLTYAELLSAPIMPGEDEEDTEVFRARCLANLTSVAFGGNQSDYKEKILTIDGVGAVKVYPVWNGGGTVLLQILNTIYRSCLPEFIASLQAQIDPTEYVSGEPVPSDKGLGIAPIGHRVTVRTPRETDINITFKLTLEDDLTYADVSANIETALEGYLLKLREGWADVDGVIVRISQIENAVLDVDGVIDIRDTAINGYKTNLTLAADEEYNDYVPKLGTVTNETATLYTVTGTITPPAASIKISLYNADNTFYAYTKSDGTFSLQAEAGTYYVKAVKEGYADYTGTITVSGSTQMESITMTRLPDYTVSGSVKERDPEIFISGASIVFSANGVVAQTATTNGYGWYETLLSSGDYCVTITADGYTAISDTLTVGAQNITENWTMQNIPPTYELTLRFNSNGSGHGATVTLSLDGVAVKSGTIFSDVAGDYCVLYVPAGTYTLAVTGGNVEDYSGSVTVSADATVLVELTVQP